MKISTRHPVREILIKTAFTLKNMTVICPLVELIIKLSTEKLVVYSLQTPPKRLSMLAKQRLKEKEAVILEIAKKAGISHPERLKLYVGSPYQGLHAAGSSALFISPERLLKEEDFPEALKLEKLRRGEISEKDYFIKLAKWLTTDFTQQTTPKKIGIDTKVWFGWIFPHTTLVEQAIVGHEIGHCVMHHAKKALLVSSILRILSLPTLGLTSFFEDRLMRKMLLRHEREADLFSAQKAGGAKGLICYFATTLHIKSRLHQHCPRDFDKEGNERNDATHPPMTKRVAYLWPYLSKQERLKFKECKGVFNKPSLRV